MSLRNLIDLDKISEDELSTILTLAGKIKENPAAYSDACCGKIMATLFFEPSTRTAMSFQTAMLRLGGQIIGFENLGNSSLAKGESFRDTIRIMSGYSDIIVMRHPIAGSALAASLYSSCPVVNAGDGGHLHPTQTLTDLVTLSQLKGRISGLTIGLCGDLKNGRTVHSLIKCLSKYEGNKFVLISTKALTLPDYMLEILKERGCEYTFANDLPSCIGDLDVLYMTRIQRERFASEEEYKAQKGIYILDMEKLKYASSDLCILHPLPKIDEIAEEVDDDPRAKYFLQAKCGVYARMALIINMLKEPYKVKPRPEIGNHACCTNPSCITAKEKYLPHLFIETPVGAICRYCEYPVE